MTSTGKKLVRQGFRVEDGIVVACNGVGLRNLLEAGEQWLEVHVNLVNSLNVFPVPDGDTGTNMLLTIRSAVQQVEQTGDQSADTMAAAAAQGALMGARGNSGVILSQFLLGLAQGVAGQTAFTAEDFGRAVRLGVDQAYRSVVVPVEGTILTVARKAAEAAQHGASVSHDLTALLNDMVGAAKAAQANTPELLPILKEAGVTDSGGQGLVYILEGGLRFMNDEPVDGESVIDKVPGLKSDLRIHKETYGYDVQFLIQGSNLKVAEIRAQIDMLGRSTVVVGDENLVKVHVHAYDPDPLLAYGASQGVVSDIVVENLQDQALEFLHDRMSVSLKAASDPVSIAVAGRSKGTTAAVGTLAVVPGDGLARIFQSLGVSRIVFGGQTMNPSTQQLLAAASQIEAENVLILPNNGNVILAAQQIEQISEKNVKIVPTRSVPQGLAALLAFNHQIDLETNARRMLEAAQQIQTIALTRAVRGSVVNRLQIRAGDVVGLLNEELTSVGQDYVGVILDVLTRLDMGIYEIFTVYYGQGGSLRQAEGLADIIGKNYPDLEIEIHNGGQPHYQYIISLE